MSGNNVKSYTVTSADLYGVWMVWQGNKGTYHGTPTNSPLNYTILCLSQSFRGHLSSTCPLKAIHQLHLP